MVLVLIMGLFGPILVEMNYVAFASLDFFIFKPPVFWHFLAMMNYEL
jgi:hypothetical protein